MYCSLPVDGVNTTFLTDSGAEISLLPSTHEAVRRRLEQLKSPDVQPVTVDGHPIPLSGLLSVKLEINNKPIAVPFYITTDDKIPPILGLDVMRRLEFMAINFQDGSVTFGPVQKPIEQSALPLPSQPPTVNPVPAAEIFRVELDSDVCIPPRHEVRIV